MNHRVTVALALFIPLCSLKVSVSGANFSFSNSAPIAIPAVGSQGAATPYPSTINVAGVAGRVGKVTLSLNSLSHTCPPDLDVLLAGPGGKSVLLMSDCAHCFISVSNVDLGFDDSALSELPQAGTTALVSGIFRPTNSNPGGADGDFFELPAPSGPYGTSLAEFNGVDPNGEWRLFIVDDIGGDTGSLTQGWSLHLSVVPEPSGLTLLGLALTMWCCRRIAER